MIRGHKLSMCLSMSNPAVCVKIAPNELLITVGTQNLSHVFNNKTVTITMLQDMIYNVLMCHNLWYVDVTKCYEVQWILLSYRP